MIREALAIARFVLSHPVGRRRPVRCLVDTLRWQLSASATPRMVPFVDGARLWARRGETGVTGNIYVGLHEFAEVAFVVHLLRPGELFADIGANAGTYTVLAAAVAGARVVAVEPVPDAADRLRANLELNQVAERVTVHRVAITNRPGTVRFTADADTVNRIAAGEEDGHHLIEVPATTLDGLFAAEPPKVLKIDVEGHEAAVLEGARTLLATGAIMALVIEMGDRSSRAAEILQRERYASFSYDPFTRSLRPRFDLGNGGNVIWVRDRAAVAHRLRAARPISVKGLRI